MIDTNRFWMHLGVFSVVAISWFVFVATGSLYSWMIIPVVSVLAMLLGKPSSMLWYGLGWFMVTQYVQQELRVGFFNYLDEFVTLGMFALLLVNMRGVNERMPERMHAARPMQTLTFYFVGLTFISALLNKSIDIYFLMWCFQYLRMFVVFFFALLFFRKRDLGVFIRFMKGFSIVMVLLNAGWRLGFNPLPNNKFFLASWYSDIGQGTFGACDQVAYFCVMVLVLCLAIILDPPSEKESKRAWWAAALTFANFVFCFTNHAYPILAAAMGIFFVVNRRQILRLVSGPALVGFLLMGALAVGLALAFTEAGRAMSPDSLERTYNRFLESPKLIAYRRSFTELPHEGSFFWFAGHGPGQAASSIARALRRPLGDKYFNVIYNAEEFRGDVIEGSIMTGEQTGYLVYWSELGPGGLLAFLLAYLVVTKKTTARLRKGDISDKYQLAIARSLPSVLAVVLLVSILRDMLYIAWFVGVFWVWAALAITPIESKIRKTGMEIL